MFFAQLLFVVTLLVRGNTGADNPVPENLPTTLSTTPSNMKIAGTLYNVTSPQPPANGNYSATVEKTRANETLSVEFYSSEIATTISTSSVSEGLKTGGEHGTYSASAAISAAEYASTLYDTTLPQSSANGDHPKTSGLAQSSEASSAELHHTSFATTESTSDAAQGQTTNKELEIRAASTDDTITVATGASSTAEYTSTLRTLPASSVLSDSSSTERSALPDVASSAELHRTAFATAKGTSDLAVSQALSGELHDSTVATEYTSTASIGTISATEYVSILYDWTSSQSPTRDYQATDGLSPAVEASSSELQGTAFATAKSTSDVAEGQTSTRELQTHAASTVETSTVAIGMISNADYVSTIDTRASPQSPAPSDYQTTDRSAPADEALSAELHRTDFSSAKSTSNLTEVHTPHIGIETASVSAAVSSATDVKVTSTANIASGTYEETLLLSRSQISFRTTDMEPQNDKASSDELQSTLSPLSNELSSSHTESQIYVSSSGEADARSTSDVANGNGFNATEIKVGEVSLDSARDYSVVGYSVGAAVLLAAVAPTVFVLVHSQGLIGHCAGRLTLSPTPSNPA